MIRSIMSFLFMLLLATSHAAPLTSGTTLPTVTPFAPIANFTSFRPAAADYYHLSITPTPSAPPLHQDWIHYRRSSALCIHENAASSERRDGYCKLGPGINGNAIKESGLLKGQSKRLINETNGAGRWLHPRILDDHLKLLVSEPLISEDAYEPLDTSASSTTSGDTDNHGSDDASSHKSPHEIKYFLQGGSSTYCHPEAISTYRLGFGPVAMRGDCIRLARYLDAQPGYFMATELIQMTPLAAMGTCYVQVIRKATKGVNISLRFATSDVAAILRSFISDDSMTGKNATLPNTVLETACSDSSLGWMVTGYYRMLQ